MPPFERKVPMILRRGCRVLVAWGVGVGVGVVPFSTPTFGATLRVNSLADSSPPGDGLVTLREAIDAANNDTTTDLGDTGSGADVIVFQAGLAGTIPLST